jgi:glycine C-acetyltransferase
MFSRKAREGFTTTLQEIKQAGLFKDERVILTPQGTDIRVKDGEVINFCANNYLGLSNHPKLVAAAKEGLEKYGYGMSSVRFICGTQDIHKTLEKEISSFLGTDDTILYSSCFDANGGLFETLLDAECAIISDALNHASVIDGIRLCKAERKVYQHGDMADLEARLKETQSAKLRMIATDGGFSMDGDLAKLDQIWTIPTAPASSGRPVAAPPSSSACRTEWMSSPAPWARRWAAPRAASPAAGRPSSTCYGSAPGPTYSPTPWRPR